MGRKKGKKGGGDEAQAGGSQDKQQKQPQQAQQGGQQSSREGSAPTQHQLPSGAAWGPPPGQVRPPGEQQQGQGRPPGQPQQGQGRPQGEQQQGQGRPPGQQQQGQGHPPGQQQQQSRPPGQQQQGQGRPPGQQQQGQGRPPGQPQQGQGRPPGQQQQGQGRPPGQPQQGQGHPPGQQQQQSRPPGEQQQGQGRPPGQQQQGQGRPPGQYQQQGRPGQQQQGQGRPPGQHQQQGRPPGQQQQGRGSQGWGQQPQQGRGSPHEQSPGPQQQGRGPPPGWVPQQQQQGQRSQPSGQQQPGRGWGQPAQQQGRGLPPGGQQQQRGPGGQGRGSGDPQRGQQQSGASQWAPGPSQQVTYPARGDAPPQTMEKYKKPDEEELAVDLLKIPLGKKSKDPRKRPGRILRIETNHLDIKLENYNIIAYHYDVVIEPDKPKFLLRPAVNAFCKREFPKRAPSYDGNKNLFSNGPLFPDEVIKSGEITVMNKENQREKTFKVTLKIANKIEMNDLVKYTQTPCERPSKALLVLDVALRARLASELILAGRGFFTPGGETVDLGNGVEMWYGYFQSSTLGWGPSLNVDVAHAGFIQVKTIREIIERDLQYDARQAMDSRGEYALSDIIKNLRVDFEIPNVPSSRRTYRVNGVKSTPRTAKFSDDDGKQWTVESYFKDVKKYILNYPNMPCLWVGSRAKEILLPSELCRITPGQAFRRKYDERQTATMVRSCAVSSTLRKEKILKACERVRLTANNPYMNEFGVSVAGQFQKLESRVLEPPKLAYENNTLVTPAKGEWTGGRFMQSATYVESWAIMNLNNRVRDNELNDLARDLCRYGKDLGLMFSEKPIVRHVDSRRVNNIETELRFFAQRETAIVFVIVQDRGDNYATVKTIAELKVGVLTQCIKSFTLQRKLNMATVKNILLKVNAKLGGVNHTLAPVSRPGIFSKPVMVVGADVTHPAPGQGDTVPSVAAVAASYDPQAIFKYNIVTRIQQKGEMIVDMENIMREQLMFFYKKTGQRPFNIIMFRDGVSEGEIQKVMSVEVMAIRRACKSLQQDGKYEPLITFIVVQKRHHTRFFPLDRVDDRRNNNVPAGTVVDTHIVHPFETEYFLVSHASIQGTARPTKYRRVCDDADFDEDELEKLTYYLCHMFTRCSRSVSYPAPTYYAHLAAFRVRSYLDHDPIKNMTRLDEEQRKRTMVSGLKEKHPMHFV